MKHAHEICLFSRAAEDVSPYRLAVSPRLRTDGRWHPPVFIRLLKIFKKLLTIALWRAILKRSKPLKRRYADNAPTESPKC